MASELTPEAQAERERCQRIAEAVMISARNISECSGWSQQDKAAWEARIRAASDILTVIRSGGEV